MPGPQTDPNSVVSHMMAGAGTTLAMTESETGWSAERMAAAAPFDIDQVDMPPLDKGMMKQVRPPTSGPRRRTFRGVEQSRNTEIFSPGFSAGLACTRVDGTTNFPYRAVGKLFVRVGGADRSGTAFVIGERAIVTAGHCIFPDMGGQWADEVMFAPHYANGSPAGQWHGRKLHILAGWQAQGSDARCYDIGGILLDRPVEPVTQRIGWYANIAPQQGLFQAVGYPRHWVSPSHDFDGEEMWRCTGDQLASGAILKMANNMTQGASGGPWLIARGGQIYANGLNSFRQSSEPDALASPYFGAGFVNLVTALTRPS